MEGWVLLKRLRGNTYVGFKTFKCLFYLLLDSQVASQEYNHPIFILRCLILTLLKYHILSILGIPERHKSAPRSTRF